MTKQTLKIIKGTESKVIKFKKLIFLKYDSKTYGRIVEETDRALDYAIEQLEKEIPKEMLEKYHIT